MKSRSWLGHNNGMLSGWNQPSEKKRSGRGGGDEVERVGKRAKRERVGERREAAAYFEVSPRLAAKVKQAVNLQVNVQNGRQLP